MKKEVIRWRRYTMSAIFCLLAAVTSFAQIKLSTTVAKRHVGQKATVCGRVTHTSFASAIKGQLHIH